ncbi:MAG TPA: hypothetical protein VHO70_19725 [Chitinispirillaceae bacterium]|nr:hypothetical protein [Chitinispirillaceae bacterium]
MKAKKYPKISIASLIQRASDITNTCYHDKEDLLKVLLPWDRVEQLAELIPLLSEADSLYQLQLECNAVATAKLYEYIDECKKLRTKLRAAINTAFKLCGHKLKIPGMSQKREQCEIAQDLNDLAVVCQKNRESFSKVHFDFKLEERAVQACVKLSAEVADLALDRECVETREFTIRKKIYDELCQVATEICLYGNNAFCDKPERKRLYRPLR